MSIPKLHGRSSQGTLETILDFSGFLKVDIFRMLFRQFTFKLKVDIGDWNRYHFFISSFKQQSLLTHKLFYDFVLSS